MGSSLHSRVGGDRSRTSGQRNDARWRLAAASLLAVLLIGTTAAGSVWRYEVALGHTDVALQTRAEALRAQRANTAFWQEREAMNEYLLKPQVRLLEKLATAQSRFDAETKELADGNTPEHELVVLSRDANTRFLQTFAENRGRAGLGSRLELPVVTQLNAAEAGVVQPLAALQAVFLREVEQRHTARSNTDVQALVAALLSALVAAAATACLALYCRRLLTEVHARRIAEQYANTSQYEFAEMLQGAEAEEEADELLKRQLERTVGGASHVVVLRRNNSADRLLATTEPDVILAERLTDAEPRSCLAVRFSRTHEEREDHKPLITCALCSHAEGFSTCQPLLVGGEVLGATLVRHARPLSEPEHAAIIGAVGQAGPVLANLRNLGLARFRAATDALTGLPNSREVQDTLKRMAAHASRTLSPLAAMMLDLDHFKQINDSYGHGTGDDVLAALGTTVQAILRTSDFVGRYGGEEFVILLPDTGRAEAEIVAEKIRAAVATITVSDVTRPITASIGVAVLPDDAADSITLLRNADRALYAAKSNGRNRVELAQLLSPTPASISDEPAYSP
jgi:diguanylate cyclase (GGDEF)-like protein